MVRIGLVVVAAAPLLLAACRTSSTRVTDTRAAPAPPAAAGPATTPEPTGETSGIEKALRSKRPMNLDWDDQTTVPTAVEYLRTITGLNYYVTPKAQVEMERARVPLKVESASAADVLDVLTSRNGLAWKVRDGLVRITTADEVRGSGTPR